MESKGKILVTGAAGYIGSVLVPKLLQEGYTVVALDNFMYNQNSLLNCCDDKSFAIVRGEAGDEQLISKLLIGADYIIPLACLTGAPLCDKDPARATATNLDAIKMLLKLRKPDQKIIFPTTNSGYGVGQEGIFCDENTPLNPISLYGKLKVEAEKAILEAGNAITLRLATVFGISPRMRLDLLVNDFVFRAVNDRFVVLFEGNFKRNYVYIQDVARAFIYCLNNFERMKNEPHNLGLDSANLSKLELCEEIKKQVPSFVFIESKVGEDQSTIKVATELTNDYKQNRLCKLISKVVDADNSTVKEVTSIAMVPAGETYVFNQELLKSDNICIVCSEISFDINVEGKKFSALEDYLKSFKIPNDDVTYFDYITKSQDSYYQAWNTIYTPFSYPDDTSRIDQDSIDTDQESIVFSIAVNLFQYRHLYCHR